VCAGHLHRGRCLKFVTWRGGLYHKCATAAAFASGGGSKILSFARKGAPFVAAPQSTLKDFCKG
jgi:hypothetical protein